MDIITTIATHDYYNNNWKNLWSYEVCKKKYPEILKDYYDIKANQKIYHASNVPNLEFLVA